MFHINNNDEAKPCRAKVPENCRFYKGEDDTRHYDNVADAQTFIEAKLSKENGGTLDKKVRYSFVKEFKKQEEKFNEDFEGIPNRFFNADLRGKFANAENTETELKLRYMNISGLGTRLLTSLSAPSDNSIDSEQAVKLLSEQGFEDIQEINSERILKGFKSNRAWKARLEDKDIVIVDGNAGPEISRYAFRMPNDYFKSNQYWSKLDLRKVAGNARAEKKTGINVIKTIIRTESVEAESKKFKATSQAIIDATEESKDIPEALRNEIVLTAKRSDYKRSEIADALMKLEDAQLEGSNFIAQKKYVREHSGSVATAYEDKKNPDKIRQDMMKNTRLNKYFRKVEIDNDVDPAEFAQFEKDYEEVMDKLPKIPKGKEPELRIRRLGKHKAHGVYFPHKNTVTIDVNTSGSFVHEMAHQYDFAIKNNASLREDFREISKEYANTLKVPAGEPASKLGYLNTPTEILARGAEHFYHFEKGIDNKLIDTSKFENYDHAPFKNPELRKKVFAFFEKLHEEDNK